MRPDGSGLTQVTKGDKSDSSPAWAPNGEIRFIRLGDVFAVQPDGRGLRQLTKNGTIERFALSADGKTIAIQNGAAKRVEAISVRRGDGDHPRSGL